MTPDIFEIPTTLALSIMALLGYVFGVLPQRRSKALLNVKRDLAQAQLAISELEKVVGAMHKTTTKHYSRLKGLKSRLGRLNDQANERVMQELCGEVESILSPTLEFVGEIASAQESIRHHNSYLMHFSEMQTDPLTGLNNRRALDTVLRMQFGQLQRYGSPFSLVMIDIDHFKSLNDSQGHLHGDEALRNLTALLLRLVRATDIVARFGGDEFVVVMPHTDLGGAEMLAERLREKVAEEVPFTISVGVASASDADTVESLFQRADAALYRAKSEGRDCTRCHHGASIELLVKEAASAMPNDSDVLPGKAAELELGGAAISGATIDDVPQIVNA